MLKSSLYIDENITLDPITSDGLADFHKYSILPELYEHLEYEPFLTLEDSEKYLKKLIQRSELYTAQYWFVSIIEKKDKKVIGSFGVHSYDENRDAIELGYGLSPEYWGRGIFHKVASSLIGFLFEELRIHRIVARTAIENYSSIKGLEKLLFRKEGVLRDYYKYSDGSWHDSIIYSRLSTD